MTAQTLRSIRIGQGRTLEDQATLAGVVPSTLSRLERGTQMPRARSFPRIAEAYGLPADRFYSLAIIAKDANSIDDTAISGAQNLSSARNIAQDGAAQ